MSAKRAGYGTSRVRGPDVDAGLHTDTDAGPIDVGLALSETAAGMMVDAPGLGQLRVAFETAGDGSIRLTSLSRKSSAADLFVAPLMVVDRARVDELEGEVATARAAHQEALARLETLESALGALTAQRDEAQATGQSLDAELTSITAQRDEAESALSALTTLHDNAISDARILEERFETVTKERDEALSKIAILEVKLGTLTVQRDDARGEGQSRAVRLVEVTAERDFLRSKLAASLERLELAKQEHQARQELLEAQRVDEVAKVEERLTREVEDARRSGDATRPRLEHAEQLSRQLSERIAAESRKVFELEASLGEATRSVTSITEERDTLTSRVQELEPQLATATSELEKVTEDHAVLTQRQKRTSSQKDALTGQVAALEASAATLNISLEAFSAQNVELRTRLTEAEQAAEAIAPALQAAEQTTRERSEELATERLRAIALETALGQEREALAKRQLALEEEQGLRDEMVKDLAFIQSQVSDLSTTKGALVSRIDSMSKRETKRQKSTADSLDLLRDAEVVAADKQTTARRLQAHAGKLEEQLVELRQLNEALEARLAAAETAHTELVQVTRERDGLKIDIAFFQKQIGAMQRNARPAPAPAVVAPPVPVAPEKDAIVLPSEWDDLVKE